MKRRTLLAAAAFAANARAQPDWRRLAVPYITPQDWLRALDERWYAPRAAAFARNAAALAHSLSGSCARAPARSAWRDAMLAWETLIAVPTGALIERRSQRMLDFQPTRPAASERAMAEPTRELAQIGAPAQGLPALEWLLWRGAGPELAPAACAYARRVAGALSAEAAALAAAFAAPRERDDDRTQRDFATLVNQFVGGVDALRWQQIGRPRREGRGHWPRASSGLTREAWRARSEALRTLLAWQDGADASPSLEAFLRGRGLNPLADRVRRASQAMAVAVAAASPQQGALPAERAAAALKALLEAEVAPAQQVSIGFSDADGD